MGVIKQLRDTEPFSSLPEDLLKEIEGSVQKRNFSAGDIFFKQNNKPTGYLYVIADGTVEIAVMSPGGVEMVVDYRKQGDFFGGTPIFSGEKYTGGARAAKRGSCYLIPDLVLHKAALKYPDLSRYFTKIVLSRVRNLYSDIVSEHSSNALGQMEAYPFKKRLSEIMTTEVVSCKPNDTVRLVAHKMSTNDVSAIIVIDDYGALLGLITESDLVRKVIAVEGATCESYTAWDVLSENVHSMTPETYMYEAMAYMVTHKIKHLPIVEDGDLVGIVSMRDLMRYRSQKAMLMVGAVNETETIDGLAQINKKLIDVARTLLSEQRSTPELMEILSYIHHNIIRKTVEVCSKKMAADGFVRPDIKFTFLLMGSGGRREMLLAPDQDNAFIFENFPDSMQDEVDAYFVPFSDLLVSALEQVGYPLCNGNVMVNNSQWRGRLQDWEARVYNWVHNPVPQKVRNSTIFFDFIPLVGDSSLATELRSVVHREIRAFPTFLYHLMSLDFQHKVPVGILGRFLLDRDGKHKGMISVKQAGTIYIVDCLRMFVLEKELSDVTTLDRLKRLVERNVFSVETAAHIRAAFEALTFFRIRHEIALIDSGEEASHFLNPSKLSKIEQDLLREAFKAVNKLQDAAKRHFGRGIA